MKKYIREMLDDLQRKTTKDFIPPIPVEAKQAATTDLDIAPEPAPAPALPTDLENQILSDDALERVKQLDFQAQQNEERESS